MLTGLLAPSQGSATVFGHDIRTDLPAVRSLMGVCPQHDVLFDSLTAAEVSVCGVCVGGAVLASLTMCP